ncbi:similar to Saccharomyces cerevisiae YNL195C Putative protein of unknown function [Maudiozyma saulgeensis]|uniref:Uncharacterized protein n=1 Tax=Maudiozyma saulgeensis TaxID=1789683 RepID=A0A1X7R275_9SACH|nr:similar to Saccharomyces cerevisiae YNL195C Putative protein of unknown function [Kazachstania saulgeensis]
MLGEGQTANDYILQNEIKDENSQEKLSSLSNSSLLHPEYPPTHLFNNMTPEYPDFQYMLDDENLNYCQNGILPDDCSGNKLSFDTNGIGIPGCGMPTKHVGNLEESMLHTIDPEDMVESRMDELTSSETSQNTSPRGFDGHHTPVPGCGKPNPSPHTVKPWHLIPQDF